MLERAHPEPRAQNESGERRHHPKEGWPKTELLLAQGQEFVYKTENLLHPGLSWKSPQRRRLQHHSQIIQALRRSERALGKIDQTPELRAESKMEVPRLNDLLKGGSKD